MALPEFTRGPWMPSQADDFTMPRHGSVLVVRDAHEFIVAVCGRPDITMAQANARLISAAPEIYDALRMVTETMIALAPYPPEVGEGVMAIVASAHAALAKAERNKREK